MTYVLLAQVSNLGLSTLVIPCSAHDPKMVTFTLQKGREKKANYFSISYFFKATTEFKKTKVERNKCNKKRALYNLIHHHYHSPVLNCLVVPIPAALLQGLCLLPILSLQVDSECFTNLKIIAKLIILQVVKNW